MLAQLAPLVPLIRAFVIEAESTGASGTEKRDAVVAAIEAMWPELQARIKELRGLDFDDIAPYVETIAGGVVAVFNSVFGQVWQFVSYLVTKAEDWSGFDLDGDGAVGTQPFPLEPVE